jgi:hypothetical protein
MIQDLDEDKIADKIYTDSDGDGVFDRVREVDTDPHANPYTSL